MVRAGTNRVSVLPTTSNTPSDIEALEIPLFLIDPDPDQPRDSFDEMRLDELAMSITAQGIIEPLVVSTHPERTGRYMLVAGERRWRAARMAGLTRVPVVLRDLPQEQRLAAQLEEIAPEEVGALVSFEKIRRADVRAVLDVARRRHLALTAEPIDDAKPAVQAKPARSGAHVDVPAIVFEDDSMRAELECRLTSSASGRSFEVVQREVAGTGSLARNAPAD